MLSFGIYIKEVDALIMSPEWTDDCIITNQFLAIGHQFGLTSPEQVIFIARNVKYVIDNESNMVKFGSRSKSYDIPMENVHVWKRNVMRNIKNGDRLKKLVGDENFHDSF